MTFAMVDLASLNFFSVSLIVVSIFGKFSSLIKEKISFIEFVVSLFVSSFLSVLVQAFR